MHCERVTTLVRAFSTTRRAEIDAAWTVAQSMGDDLLALLAEAFPQVRKSAGRASIIRYAGRFSRESEVAFRMGITAVQDRAYAVRHYGCAILAYSLRADALPTLSSLLNKACRPSNGGRCRGCSRCDKEQEPPFLYGQGPQREGSLGIRIGVILRVANLPASGWLACPI